MKYSDLNQALVEAAEDVLSEAKEPLFKVGDEVGLVHHNYGNSRPGNHGKVVKTNAHGHTHVDFGSLSDGKPLIRVYDHLGREKATKEVLYPSRSHNLVPKSEYDKVKKEHEDTQARNSDIAELMRHIESHRTGNGSHSTFSKLSASAMKEIIDRHTHSH